MESRNTRLFNGINQMLTLKIKAPASSVFLCTTAAVADTSNLPLAWFQGQTFRGGRPRQAQPAWRVSAWAKGGASSQMGSISTGLSTLALSFGEGLWSPAAWRGNRTTDSTGPGAGNGVRCQKRCLAEGFLSQAQGKRELLLGENMWTFS